MQEREKQRRLKPGVLVIGISPFPGEQTGVSIIIGYYLVLVLHWPPHIVTLDCLFLDYEIVV